MIRRIAGRGVMVVLVAVVMASTCGCAVIARSRSARSSSNMKQLAQMAILCMIENGAWPDRLVQLKKYAAEGRWDELITNPVTGDRPGYEYVKPASDSFDAVILYQLRGGERDLTLPVAYADGAVRPLASR